MSNICTGSKAKRGASTGGGRGGGRQGQHVAARAGHTVTAPRGRLGPSTVMERKPRLHMHAGRPGGGERTPRKAARRLRSGSRAKRGQAGSSYGAPNESPWTGLGRKESVGGNERTKAGRLCAHTGSVPTFSARQTDIRQSPHGREHRTHERFRGQEPGVWRRGGGRVGWLCTRWHKRCTCSSSWNPASLGVWSAGFGRVLSQSFKSVPVARLERPLGHPHSSHLGLHIRGEVQCVPLQFCEGNGGVLQVVEEDLDLCHDIMGPDVRSRREVCFALHFRGSQ